MTLCFSLTYAQQHHNKISQEHRLIVYTVIKVHTAPKKVLLQQVAQKIHQPMGLITKMGKPTSLVPALRHNQLLEIPLV